MMLHESGQYSEEAGQRTYYPAVGQQNNDNIKHKSQHSIEKLDKRCNQQQNNKMTTTWWCMNLAITLKKQDGGHTITLKKQDGGHTITLKKQDGRHTITLKKLDGGHTITLKKQDGRHTITLKKQDGRHTITLKKQDGGHTQQLVDGALVGHVLQHHLVLCGHHTAHQTQTVPHLRPLAAPPTPAMETVALAPKAICGHKEA